jgi:predicted acyl esterase
MRVAVVCLLLAGCLASQPPPRDAPPADVGYDPTLLRVESVRAVEARIPSWDGSTELAAFVRSPETSDLPNGSEPSWPVVVFLHGWGGGKESFAGGRGGVPESERMSGRDRLQEFAQAGFIAVAYDARGFGESTGFSDVAGSNTMADLDSVLDWVEAHYSTNGRVGLIGQSYGAGQAYIALANPRVTTAVPMYGWVDLADGLAPNGVPKLAWAQLLYAGGLPSAKFRYEPMVHEWYLSMYQRDRLPQTIEALRERNTDLSGMRKPLLVCQGLQESLFPQADMAWSAAAGFTRAYVYEGGHSSSDPGCWERTLKWMQHFLAGFDLRVDAWPRLSTVDALGGFREYVALPNANPQRLHLRAPDLSTQPSTTTFTVRQSLGAGLDASYVVDQTGRQATPRPADGVVFSGPVVQEAFTVFGAPTLVLDVKESSGAFQVAAELLVLRGGNALSLGHTAFAAPAETESVAMRFEWTHATLQPGDRLQLRVAANDASWWMPLFQDYAVTFEGSSWLDVPTIRA